RSGARCSSRLHRRAAILQLDTPRWPLPKGSQRGTRFRVSYSRGREVFFAMARVALAGVRKVYDNGHVAVEDATFDIGDGELMVLVGPSGCGKSTLLRMIAGLETVTGGTIAIGERVVNDEPPKQRDVAMVFQNYALYPHMSVYDNMAFG